VIYVVKFLKGKAIAENFVERGASVVVNYNQDSKGANELVESFQKKGGKAIAIQANIGVVADVKRLFKETVDHFGGLDILVNNAGVHKSEPVAAFTEEDFDYIINSNVKGVFFSLQEAAKIIRKGGRIVNISSGTTKSYRPIGVSVYAASKAAVEQFTRSLAAELGGKEVTVNTVSPGFTETVLLPQSDHEIGKTRSVFGRLGKPEEIAAVVGFLVSENARWVTGQNWGVNGGTTLS
jgi:3-oxoacyl-[acyl-carrier protein] reductase